MPLIDPVTMGQQSAPNGSNDLQDLQTQLIGKKPGDTSDATTFAKQDLPKDTRIIEAGGFGTTDVQPNRTNIHLGEDGTVREIKKG